MYAEFLEKLYCSVFDPTIKPVKNAHAIGAMAVTGHENLQLFLLQSRRKFLTFPERFKIQVEYSTLILNVTLNFLHRCKAFTCSLQKPLTKP